jgi:hypothetical protein
MQGMIAPRHQAAVAVKNGLDQRHVAAKTVHLAYELLLADSRVIERIDALDLLEEEIANSPERENWGDMVKHRYALIAELDSATEGFLGRDVVAALLRGYSNPNREDGGVRRRRRRLARVEEQITPSKPLRKLLERLELLNPGADWSLPRGGYSDEPPQLLFEGRPLIYEVMPSLPWPDEPESTAERLRGEATKTVEMVVNSWLYRLDGATATEADDQAAGDLSSATSSATVRKARKRMRDRLATLAA